MAGTVGLHEVFLEELHQVYDAEKQVCRALPRIIARAASPDLRQILQAHLDETAARIGKLEDVFRARKEQAGLAGRNAGVTELLKDARRYAQTLAWPGPVRDAALIGAVQCIEHYKTAVYGTLAAWASNIRDEDIARLLRDCLSETKETNWRLSRLASERINRAALNAVEILEQRGA